jgi:hypothetical protein
MIKFFRRYREKLLQQNKVGKYLAYAVGEIVLVVVGILIALSLNNWNQNRINNQRLNQYVASLLQDLESDKARLELCLEFDSTKMLIIDSLANPLPDFFSESETPYILNKILHTYSIIIHDATFVSMSSSNAMELFKKHDVPNQISKYYSNMEYLKRLEDNYINHHHPTFLEFLNNHQNPQLKDIRGYLTVMKSVSKNEVRRYKDLIRQNNTLRELLLTEEGH